LTIESNFMTTTDEIILIANQLANQGKKPTVALVKTKLKKTIPLPTIITILRNWTHDPQLVELEIVSKEAARKKTTSTSISPEIEQAIAKALQPIETELAQLKALVINLAKQQQ
jgi:Ni,Fe-hydrogenase maturation factor